MELMAKVDYTREELITICEGAFIPESQWWDRDSASAQRQVGEAYALLRAGCAYEIMHGNTERHALNTDDSTIWIKITYRGFMSFESEDEMNESDTFYLPTPRRLDERRSNGWDWY